MVLHLGGATVPHPQASSRGGSSLPAPRHPWLLGSLAGPGRPKVSEGQAGWGTGTAGPFLDLGSEQWVAQQHPRPSAEAIFRL